MCSKLSEVTRLILNALTFPRVFTVSRKWCVFISDVQYSTKPSPKNQNTNIFFSGNFSIIPFSRARQNAALARVQAARLQKLLSFCLNGSFSNNTFLPTKNISEPNNQSSTINIILTKPFEAEARLNNI
jgi:hypothetical protein